MKTYTPEDLQAVLAKHAMWLDHEKGGERANLYRADLKNADLRDANLSCADLQGADLRDANMQYANLSCADLQHANLHGANLQYADLYRANLYAANLSYADLQHADMQHANLSCADLQDANLQGADLYAANLYGVNLQGAKLNWQSHDLLFEVARRAAGDNRENLKAAGLIIAARHWCWSEFEKYCLDDPLWHWMLGVLAKYVQKGDGAPKVVRALKEAGL